MRFASSTLLARAACVSLGLVAASALVLACGGGHASRDGRTAAAPSVRPSSSVSASASASVAPHPFASLGPLAPIVSLAELAAPSPLAAPKAWNCPATRTRFLSVDARGTTVTTLAADADARLCDRAIGEGGRHDIVASIGPDGAIRWIWHAPDEVTAPPAIGPDAVYVGIRRIARNDTSERCTPDAPRMALAVVALDATSGDVRWVLPVRATSGQVDGLAALSSGAVIVGGSFSKGALELAGRRVEEGPLRSSFLARLSRAGALEWLEFEADPMVAIATDGVDVAVLAGWGEPTLATFDPADGRRRWKRYVGSARVGPTSLVMLDDGRVALFGTTLPERGGDGVGLSLPAGALPAGSTNVYVQPPFYSGRSVEVATVAVWAREGELAHVAAVQAVLPSQAASVAALGDQLLLWGSIEGRAKLGGLAIGGEATRDVLLSTSAHAEPRGVVLVRAPSEGGTLAGSRSGWALATHARKPVALGLASDTPSGEVLLFRPAGTGK
jgi:outer membrane protein assembly factor BamB